MAWFKVDDGFYDHPKLDRLPNAAVGLWVKAGAWCSKHETDGVIPASRVKALKGTTSQISSLIRCGLWVETESESGAKAYSFRDWFDYQPSRKERQEERAMWREKKRESRRRKMANQLERRNVPRGVPEMSPEETNGGVPEMSGTIPVPSRPDHINKGREVPYGSSARETENSPEFFDGLDALAAAHAASETPDGETPDTWSTPEDPRCKRHSGLPREQVPRCVDCRRAREWFTTRALQAIENRRTEIDACPHCDQNGMREATIDGTPAAIRCDHTPEDDDLPPWEKHA